MTAPLPPFQSRTLITAALALAILAPWIASGFQVFQLTQIWVYAIAIVGLNLLTGFNGQISLGHGAFYAIGAYSEAILVSHFGLPYWGALPFAAAISFAAGFSFGLPALKLEGHYLALATFALALAVPQLLKYEKFEDWTGGVQGLFLDKPEAPLHLPLDADQWLYYFTLIITLGLFYLANNLLDGRVGRAITAIRDQPVAAESMGVDVALFKTLTFGVSALYTGVAGAMSAIVIQFVAPDSFTMFLSIYLLVGVVIGGVGSLYGAFIGAAFIVLIPDVASSISKAATGAIYGIMLIALMYVLPSGGWGLLEKARAWLGRARRAPASGPAPIQVPERRAGPR
jgi:branched-chain amino acid transport system permease protein